MKIAAILGVKNEVEIIAAAIDHLRNIGVDQIVITDYGSTDGTVEALEANARFSDVVVTALDPATPYDAASWSARELALARQTQADWVVFLDADEFWIPATGSIRDCISLGEADVVVVDRFNIPLTPNGITLPTEITPTHYEKLLLFVRRVPDLRLFTMENPTIPFIRGVPARKIMVRPTSVSSIALGHHGAEPVSGKPLRTAVASDLVVAHAPFTTLKRFEKKISSIENEMRVNPHFFEGTLSWHWRRWIELAKRGDLVEEYNRQVHDEDTLRKLATIGDVRSARDLFKKQRSTNIP